MYSRAVDNEQNGAVTREMIEHEISRLGSAPIAERFIDRLDELTDLQTNEFAELIQEVKKAVARRTKELKRFPVVVDTKEHNFDLEQESLERLKRAIEKVVSSGDFLGQGASAEVYADPSEPTRCFKIIKNFEEYAKVNPIDREAALMSLVADINVDGVRVPRPHYWAVHPEYVVLSMDRLHAVNVAQVLRGDSQLPKNFDLDRSMKALQQFIEAIHERSVYHRDLNPQNVMLDTATGMPYVIDLGKSAQVLGSEDPYTNFNANIDSEDRYPNDDIKVRELRTKLAKLITKK